MKSFTYYPVYVNHKSKILYNKNPKVRFNVIVQNKFGLGTDKKTRFIIHSKSVVFWCVIEFPSWGFPLSQNLI